MPVWVDGHDAAVLGQLANGLPHSRRTWLRKRSGAAVRHRHAWEQ